MCMLPSVGLGLVAQYALGWAHFRLVRCRNCAFPSCSQVSAACARSAWVKKPRNWKQRASPKVRGAAAVLYALQRPHQVSVCWPLSLSRRVRQGAGDAGRQALPCTLHGWQGAHLPHPRPVQQAHVDCRGAFFGVIHQSEIPRWSVARQR